MFKKSSIGSGVALLVAGFMPVVAAAQSEEGGKVEKVEAVVVTGSRIVRPNLTSSTPVVAIGQEQLGAMGMENFADMATQLPQFAPAFGASRTQSTFRGVSTSGLNNANLRNLGTNRSLVLINGRRVPGGSTTDTAVDFNSIPTANIERVEVITGGASAIYGADAVAGVINIITKKNVQGIELGLNYSESGKGDNKNPTASLLVGGKLGESGHALLTFQLDSQGRVSCADRAFCSDDFYWGAPGSPVFGPAARSGVGVAGRFFIGGKSYTRRDGSFTDASGKLIPFDVTVDGYNRNINRDLAIPTHRWLAAAETEYTLGNGIKVFAELNAASTRVDSNFEGHPFQSSSDLYAGIEPSIPANNPFIPAALRAEMARVGATQMTWWQRFSDESIGGDRGVNSIRTMLRGVAGAQGHIGEWQWELSHTYGSTRSQLGQHGVVGLEELYNGLRVVETSPGSGVYQCADAAARAKGCVPVNPFATYTRDMSSYLTKNTTTVGANSLNDTVVQITGSPFALPAGPVRTAFGGEYRSFGGYLDYDSLLNSGMVTGNKSSDIAFNQTKTRETFGEILVPVLADKPFANSLNLEGALRHSKTSSYGYSTWKLGGDWEPTESVRFRAMKARAVRAPVPDELSGASTTAGTVQDPCSGARRTASAMRAANCAADGVPDTYVAPQTVDQSVQGLLGGNPNLRPEVGTTMTYGVVFQPAAVKGLQIAVDRFTIDLRDMISSVSRQLSANLCYDTKERLLCDAVHRGSNPLVPGANYVLTAVDSQNRNVAAMQVSGVDLDLRYSFKTAQWGEFDLSALATIYDKAQMVPLTGQPVVDLLGQAGGSTSDQGYIRRTANGNVAWKYSGLKVNWNMRHIGRADMSVGSTEAGFPQIGAHTYHNLRFGYVIDKKRDVYFGINNVMDKKPPMFASGMSGTQALDTIPGYYDIFGRSFFAGVNYKF